MPELLHVLPSFPVNNVADSSRVHSVGVSNLLHSVITLGVSLSNFTYHIFGQLCGFVCFSSMAKKSLWLGLCGMPLSSGDFFRVGTTVVTISARRIQFTLIPCVDLIVTICTKEQVRRVHAGRVVARVANKHLAGIGITPQVESDSRRAKHPTASLKQSVTRLSTYAFSGSSVPRPAFTYASFCEFCFKALDILRGKQRKSNMRFSQISLLNRLNRLGPFERSSRSAGRFILA